MNWLRRLFGYDDKFFDLLEASAVEAQSSVELLVDMLRRHDQVPSIDEFAKTRRKDKRITEEITEQLCKTFVTPLDREDIEALSVTLYKVPKTVEKFIEKFLICHDLVHDMDFSKQIKHLSQATAMVTAMVKTLRYRPNIDRVKEQNDQLHYLEGEADKLILLLYKGIYAENKDPLKMIAIMDLYETLEKAIDRCRDAGNVIFQIVLKYS